MGLDYYNDMYLTKVNKTKREAYEDMREKALEKRRLMKMNEDMKHGYILALTSINDEIDEMIEELHNAYMNHKNEDVKGRLDAQIKILWNVKSRCEDKMAE